MGKAGTDHRQMLLGGRLICPGSIPDFIPFGYIKIVGGIITEVGSGDPSATEVDELIDLSGLTVLPGMINAHTHLYSILALGMPPSPQPPGDFREILESVWWKLDRALDAESVQASFEVGLLKALTAGVTTIFDHHSSPNYVDGSLSRLAAAAGVLGMNVAVAFEATGRNGAKGFQAALAENLAARQQFADDPHVCPLLGLHASFTLSDESLKQARQALEGDQGWGLHIHLAEDQADQSDAVERGYPSVVQRLAEHGLIGERSLLAHGLHLEPGDLDLLERARALLVHNPTSNANNRVGLLPAETIQRLHPGLGTDGMQAAVLSEAKEGTLIRSSHLPCGGAGVDYLTLLFENNAELASRLFNRPLGRIQPDHQADLAIYDYHPRTEINAHNWRSHLLYGMGNPRDVMTQGRYRLYDGAVVDVQEADVRRRAREQSVRLWHKMKTI